MPTSSIAAGLLLVLATAAGAAAQQSQRPVDPTAAQSPPGGVQAPAALPGAQSGAYGATGAGPDQTAVGGQSAAGPSSIQPGATSSPEPIGGTGVGTVTPGSTVPPTK
jgi:hypothetical protein